MAAADVPPGGGSPGEAVPVESLDVRAYTFPVDPPESDGTLVWDSHTAVVVLARAGGRCGLGWSYTQTGAVDVAREKLTGPVVGGDALRPAAAWGRMVDAVRNLGSTGIAMAAVSAVDVALWDLAARLLGAPLSRLLGGHHDAVPVYGSGGFCSYPDSRLRDELAGWVEQGIPRVKMKTGRDPGRDRERLAVARSAVGDDVELYVDANGAFSRKQALAEAEVYADAGVRWFEEPVSSDDLAGLRLLRDRGPAGMDVAAGEYGWDLPYFERMLAAESVDCLQADVTRCGGVTGFLKVGALCDARSLDLSAHCAPQLSAHACTGVWHLRHLEWFADHVAIEHRMLDGCLEPEPGGVLRPDPARPGLGLALREPDVEDARVR